VQSSMSKVCFCGHEKEVHEHYRFGSDCSICGRWGCNRYLHGATGWMVLQMHHRAEQGTETHERPVLRLVK
jgi:hypothetical protein